MRHDQTLLEKCNLATEISYQNMSVANSNQSNDHIVNVATRN